MPATISHALSATTPDDPLYEIRPSHWNSVHNFTLNASGSEISNAFGNGGGVSFGLSADGKITASAGAAGLTNINVSAGTTSNNLSALTFANGNGVSFGLNASTITASHNGLTSQSNQALSGSNGSFAFQTATFGNLNGVSFYTSNGSMVAKADINIGVDGNTTGATSESSYPITNFWMVGAGIVSLGHTDGFLYVSATQSNQAASASNGSFTFQTLNFSNANNVTFGTSAGGIISASVPSQSVQTAGFVVTANSTGQSSSSTYDPRTLSVIPGGIVSAGWSNGSFLISATQSNQAASASNGSFTFQTLNFSNANNVTFGTSAGGIVTASINAGGAGFSAGVSNLGNTAGSTGATGTRLVLVGTNGVTLSQSTDANGGTVSFSAGGGAGATLSAWEPNWNNAGAAGFFNATQYPGNGSIHVFPMLLQQDHVLSKVLGSVSLALSTSSNSSHGGTLSFGAGIYSRNGSSLSLISSALGTYAWTNTSNNSTASLSGIREVSASFAGQVSLTPGDYWLGVWSRTSTVNANWFTASNIYAMTSGSNSTHSGDFMAAAAAASFQPGLPGQGTFSATSAALPASMAFSNITGTARWWYRPRIAMRNFNG